MAGVCSQGSRPDENEVRGAQLAAEFLADYDGRALPWTKPVGAPATFNTDRILFGDGDNALEVAIAYTTYDGDRPRSDSLRTLWKKRQPNRPSPVLLVTIYGSEEGQSRAAVVGPTGDPSPLLDLSVTRVARIAVAALNEPDRHAATRTLDRLLASLKDQLTPGLINSGLFASTSPPK